MVMTAFARRDILVGLGLLATGRAVAMTGDQPSSAARMALSGSSAVPDASSLPTLDRSVVLHSQSGIAIGGFDPVAYFTEGQPTGGRREIEFTDGTIVWRFASEANRTAFIDSPDTYRPMFGGYDPTAITEGFAVETTPEIFSIIGDQLLLFRTRENRERIAREPGLLERAARLWPVLARQLVR